MLDKKISVSEQVANLSEKAQIVFTWSIPHADDLGLLPHSSKTLKAMVVPMMDIDLNGFEKIIKEIRNQGLWSDYKYGKELFFHIVKFKDHQTLKKDRKPVTYLNGIDNWNQVEKLGFRLEDDGIQMEDGGNPSKDKIREVKRREDNKEALTPKEKALLFFESVDKKNDNFHLFIKTLAQNNKVKPDIIQSELIKFAGYWTELNGSGTKQRWQMEKVFDIRRRLATWFSRVGFKNFSSAKGKTIIE